MYKVMLVEDESVIRAGIKKIVEEVIGGFTVVAEAENGKEALEKMKLTFPEVIITDIRMKDMDGLVMIERIREQNSEVLIMIISGHNDFEYAKRALRSRVADYLLKPIDRVEMARSLEQIKKLLKNKTVSKGAVIAEAAAKDADFSEERSIIRKIKEIIHSRLGLEISLQYIADQVDLKPQYVSALFKNETGQNFIDYITESRMEKSKKLLDETTLKVYEIGGLVGYPNAKHFMTIFKLWTGITPTEYRDRQR